MNQNQKAAVHTILIPAQIVVHSRVDRSLKNNGVGITGRVLAQMVLLGLGVVVHNAIENA